MKEPDGLFKSDRHYALPEDSVPMKLYRIAFPKRPKLAQKTEPDLIDTEPAGIYWPACKRGPCDGGNQPCPTAEACLVPELTEPVRLFAEGKWANIAVMVALIAATVVVAAYILTGHWPKYLF